MTVSKSIPVAPSHLELHARLAADALIVSDPVVKRKVEDGGLAKFCLMKVAPEI
jgi:hypothetical protein